MHDAATGGEIAGVLAVLVIFGMPIVYLIVHRYFAHQERMAMIQRGMSPPPDPRWARSAARQGWYQMPNQTMGGYDPLAYGEWQANRSLRKGITTAMIGFALLVGLSIGLGPSGPWLLGGLIPLFVGLAQIIVAVLGGARFGTFGTPPSGPDVGPQPGPQYQQQQPPPYAESGTTPSGPYGWRPGNTTELNKPPSPPEPR